MSKLNNLLSFCLYICLNPGLIALLLKGIYIPAFVQYRWLRQIKIGSVVDVGALDGKTSRAISNLFPDAKIYAFEPLAIKSLNGLPVNVVVEHLALSNREGKLTFYKYKGNQFSSLLPFNRKFSKKFLSDKAEKIKVDVTTLDKYFANIHLNKPVFLKIDTQGSEGLILEGGKRFLKDISIIHIETSFIPIYKNQALFKNIYNLLTNEGFEYIGNIPDANFYQLFNPQLQQNSIFIRKGFKFT